MFYPRVGSDPATTASPVQPGSVRADGGAAYLRPREASRDLTPPDVGGDRMTDGRSQFFMCSTFSGQQCAWPQSVLYFKVFFLIELNYSFIHQSLFMVFISVY